MSNRSPSAASAPQSAEDRLYTAIVEASPEDIAGVVSRIQQTVMVRALYDFEADDEDNISFNVGEYHRHRKWFLKKTRMFY